MLHIQWIVLALISYNTYNKGLIVLLPLPRRYYFSVCLFVSRITQILLVGSFSKKKKNQMGLCLECH